MNSQAGNSIAGNEGSIHSRGGRSPREIRVVKVLAAAGSVTSSDRFNRQTVRNVWRAVPGGRPPVPGLATLRRRVSPVRVSSKAGTRTSSSDNGLRPRSPDYSRASLLRAAIACDLAAFSALRSSTYRKYACVAHHREAHDLTDTCDSRDGSS